MRASPTHLPLYKYTGISFLLDYDGRMSDVWGEALEYEDSFERGQERRRGQVKFCDFHLEWYRQNNKEEWRHVLLGVSLSLVAFVWLPGKVLPQHFPEIAQLFGMITGNHRSPGKELCLAGWLAAPRCRLGGGVQLAYSLSPIRSWKVQEKGPAGLWRDWPKRMDCEGWTQAPIWE